MPFLAQRLNRIQPSPTLSLIARAHALKAEGRDVINLGAGEPDFDTPEWIKEKAKQAITDGFTKYTPVDGTVALKKAIQSKFQKENNLTYGLDEITVANGGKQIIFNALIATVEEGDDVLIPSPYWVSYPDIVNLCGGNALIIPCQEDNHFRLSHDQLIQAITPKTKWLILNSPSNPTGTVYSKEDLLSLGKVLLDYPHIYILSDDIYEHLIYDDHPFYSLASLVPELKQRILTVNGLSKSYSMTGWRIGYG
ncbi:MAG: pyridoxal phosphate-dependent aminotransferase, partial [Proteobacteria bacterium]|nr:pyridoxal phosphate-dependent aminotransferase [Pseudomonadota bacterium]